MRIVNLQEYIERSRILDLSIVPKQALPDLLRLLEEDVQLPELVQDYRHLVEGLPRAQLHRLFEARTEWRARQRAMERLTEALVQSGRSVPPHAVRARALARWYRIAQPTVILTALDPVDLRLQLTVLTREIACGKGAFNE